MVEITISIPKDVYDAVESVLDSNKVPKQDPTNPKRTIVEPEFATVEAWIEKVVEDNIAPITSRMPSPPDVAAIEAEIAARQQQIATMRKSVAQVRKGAPKKG